jgi:hypothetical protein
VIEVNNVVGGIGQYWPLLFLILKIMAAVLIATPFLAWPVARFMRRRAYGPGGGRKAPRYTLDEVVEPDPWVTFQDLPPLGHDADMTPGPRIGDGWMSAAPYGAKRPA